VKDEISMTEELKPDAVTPETVAPATNKRWYVVHAYSGMEKAVERNLRERIDRSELQDKFGRILVPMEEVVELKNGKKSVSERRFFPGYVLVEMEMGDDSWHLVKHTSKVTGFVGGAKNRPSPISAAEVLKIVHQMQEGVEKPRPKVQWVVGELVRIKEGPFTDFNGAIEDVNYDKSKVRVSVTIFGRATPVELDFAQVEKV
jgi:transcription termination/antitermination protein NusG